MEQDRRDCLERILGSTATHKIVVSGPGTGKTYTFQQLIENDPGENLIITLINNLVHEMQDDLGDLAEVRTFHSLARKLLHRNPFGGITSDFHFFPNLYQIISEDSTILTTIGLIDHEYSVDDLGYAFRVLDVNNEMIDYFIQRSNYYNAVSFDDSVYRILSLFRENPESIPRYHNVMIDEFQDFNALEVGVIESLEDNNRMLIVGDDDQSIYEFRQASPNFLREKIRDERYVRFPLPYCTRCTSVIISTVESIIKNAQNAGMLSQRLEKQFVCYLPDKQTDSETYPSIKIANCTVHRNNAPYIPKYIESIISRIHQTEYEQAIAGNYPIALVVGPGHYLDQIYAYLNERLPNVVYKPRSRFDISLIDGFKLLQEQEDSNLGWRIISSILLPETHPNLVENSSDNQTRYASLLGDQFMSAQYDRLGIIDTLLYDPDSVSQEDKDDLVIFFDEPLDDIINEFLGVIETEDKENNNNHPDTPPVLLTNYNGCKGLSAGFTFITGFEEGIFPSSNADPSFTEICQLIVALTRTRKECHLVHTRNFAGSWTRRSLFLDWLDEVQVELIDVDKNYFLAT